MKHGKTLIKDKCIICLKEESDINPLTDEHVIPEFMGGTFYLKNVCKGCNSKMGASFEGRLSNHIIFIFNREDNNIVGKTKYTKNPLAGAYIADDGTKYLLDHNSNLTIPKKIDIQKIDNNKHSLIFTQISENETDFNEIKDEITAYALAKLKKDDPSITHIDLILEDQDTSSIGTLKLEKAFTLNERDLKLLALKICYEMYIYILNNSENNKLLNNCLSNNNKEFKTVRKYLENCDINIAESKQLINIMNKDSEQKLLINDEGRYIIKFTPGFCIIKFLCFSFMIKSSFNLHPLTCFFDPSNKKLSLQLIEGKEHEENYFFKNIKVKILTDNQITNRMILNGFFI
ncbi:HNH endonuclease [Acinetobacter bereziniae]|uniref:HNH endonuclease n=1 Tax=Acinetobacter bereziniae TaxID=106648 RepID=UPI0021CF152E|nr:HNH endonuclease [Acinetobacter bereziniae]MCU4314881.1 HNH endonuclease [Acinetobacter bereziniae]